MNNSEYRSLAYQYKRQMNDVVFYTYKGSPRMKEYQNFTIECHSRELKTKLGDCWFSREGCSKIRVFYMESENWENVLVTLIHEVAHHVDFKNRGHSGHDKQYYEVHKKLLFTALDMGIISYDIIQNFWNSHAQNAKKLAKLMSDYEPHPIPYKVDTCTIFVYNAFPIKETLKTGNYRWNSTDQSWYKEMDISEAEREREFLLCMGVPEENIVITEMKGVVSRRKGKVQLYGVTYEKKDEIKALGYRWDRERKIWYKRIEGEDISPEEREKILSIGEIKIKVLR